MVFVGLRPRQLRTNLHNWRLGLAGIDALGVCQTADFVPRLELKTWLALYFYRRKLCVRLRAQGVKRLSQAREREKEMLHTRYFK